MIDNMLSFLTEIISNDTAGAFPATTNDSSHGHKTTTCSKLFPTKRSLMDNIVKTMVFTNIDLSCTVRTLSDSETITIHAAFIKGQSNLFIYGHQGDRNKRGRLYMDFGLSGTK